MSTTAFSDAGSDDPAAMLFEGARRERSRWRLGLLILASLFAHAASFYVFQVAYTPTGSLLPPPARVVLVPLDQPKNVPLARWLSLLDPTLATQAPAPVAGTVVDSLGFRYVPSYDLMPPAFKSLDGVTPADGIASPPRPLPPGPVATTVATGVNANERRVPAAESTRVILSGGIEALAPLPLPPVQFARNTGVRVSESTIFLVGVRPEGGMPFLFPVRQAPANNANANADDADDFVRDYLARLTFRPTGRPDSGITWGQATVYWGNDALRKKEPFSP